MFSTIEIEPKVPIFNEQSDCKNSASRPEEEAILAQRTNLKLKTIVVVCYDLTMEKYYTEHVESVLENSKIFKHVMAIALNTQKNYKDGIIRCITSREGNIFVKGYIDRSELYTIERDSLKNYSIGEKLKIKNETEIINQITPKGYQCIGLEDPDIWEDKDTGLIHVYFTIPFIPNEKSKKTEINLGHAVGKDLHCLLMTPPVLMDNGTMSAKEISIAPLNKKGFRYNLIESRDRQNDTTYSVVTITIVTDMGKPWKYGETVFHPKEHRIFWIGGHASPGPFLSKNFIDLGEGKLLGIINGREVNKVIDEKIKYGVFSVGLFVYDYENGKIDWVSPVPFIQDTEARIITFASQFIETNKGEGVLYEHVDDSFVRAYT